MPKHYSKGTQARVGHALAIALTDDPDPRRAVAQLRRRELEALALHAVRLELDAIADEMERITEPDAAPARAPTVSSGARSRSRCEH